MKITLIRHAEVVKEYQGKYNGHIDIPISSRAKEELKELAKKLDGEIYDEVFCSDLLRARQTLDGLNLKNKAIFTNKLREKSWGIHEGMSFKEIEETGIKYENFDKWIADLDGESVDEFKARIYDFFKKITINNNYTNILVITHSGVIKVLENIINKISLEKSFSLSVPYLSVRTFENMSI